ncbi:hybrid sensor histidine kinase/response regulator [Noviherbaspirillum aridicola]|nr:ATP-binding protein [Noviherbaspirillum aridicola]
MPLQDLALAIAENSVHGIVVMDDDGYCLYDNRAWTEITGFTAQDMVSKPVHDWVHHHHPDERPFPITECPIGNTLGRNENVRNHRDLFFRKDGSPFHVSCAASTISVDGAPSLKILEIRDITDDMQVERRKDEFLAMLAHELRNPLAPIAAAADLLQVGRLDAAGMKQASDVISRQVSHMSALINDLLDVSRVTRGQIRLERRDEDIRGIIAEAVEQVRPLVEARRHWVAVNTSPGSTFVHGDRKRLVQVFANILANAAKYTPDGGEIAVSIDARPGELRVEIADNGIGMSEEMTSRAFELFTQAERAPDRMQGGLGIGLALVRSLVALHGGSVAARSAGEGRGTTITVVLPAVAPQAAPAEAAGRGKTIPRVARPLKIMVVDDRRDAAEMLGMLLTSLGHRVRLEFDSHAALAAAGEENFDAFLLDVGLPGMDGMELARRIRGLPRHGEALLVAVTGYGQLHDRDKAIDSGFDHHLIKPADLQRLSEILDAAATEPARRS